MFHSSAIRFSSDAINSAVWAVVKLIVSSITDQSFHLLSIKYAVAQIHAWVCLDVQMSVVIAISWVSWSSSWASALAVAWIQVACLSLFYVCLAWSSSCTKSLNSVSSTIDAGCKSLVNIAISNLSIFFLFRESDEYLDFFLEHRINSILLTFTWCLLKWNICCLATS